MEHGQAHLEAAGELPIHEGLPSSDEQPRLTRKEKRLRRQKLAKLYKRAAVQESSHSEAAEDYELQLAYEQHLRQLQQQYPSPPIIEEQQRAARTAHKGANHPCWQDAANPQQQQQKYHQQQQQQRDVQTPGGGSAKRRRRRGGYTGTGPEVGGRGDGSVDTIASSVALSVPPALPIQQLAQISELAEPPSIEQQQQLSLKQQQEQQQQQAVEAPAPLHIATLAGEAAPACRAQLPVSQAAAGDSSSGLPHHQDWSGAAALLGKALMQRQEAEVLEGAAAKTAGICRLDLSAAALLINSQLTAGGTHTFQQPTLDSLPLHCDPSKAADAAADAVAATVDAAAGAVAGLGVAAVPVAGAAAQQAPGAAAPEQARPADGWPAGGAKWQRRKPAIHGNYHRYYGYRYFGDQRPEDPRLAVLERKWFARRRCLDVGCNEGLVTLALVQRYHPRSMLGVDIDRTLIARACSHLRDARSSAVQRERLVKRGGVAAEERKEARAVAASLSQTRFVHTDFLEGDVAAASLDTITCLSVTKWVHLNRGDAGVRALFATFLRALVPGGLLILEPQPWSSYRAAASKIRREQAPQGSFFHRLDELYLRPDRFADCLCEELGFRLVKRLGVEESAAGFDRPILLLRKPTH